MLESLKQIIILWVRSRTGLTAGLIAGALIAAGTAATTFVFLCAAGYIWLSTKLGPVLGGLAMAGIFLVIAIIAAAASALLRKRTKQQAIIERSALAPRAAILLDPKVLNFPMQTGRVLGWQRILPLALLGFLATRLVQQGRRERLPDEA
jgi:hypothetical protein